MTLFGVTTYSFPTLDDGVAGYRGSTSQRFQFLVSDLITLSAGSFVKKSGDVMTGSLGINKSNPQNASLYVGSGTGSLTDLVGMGIKSKVDTTPTSTVDAIQANTNIISGSASGRTGGVTARVDVNDVSSTGDVAGLWGDVFVHAASARNTWGTNTYVSIDAGSGYTGTSVGAEISVFNNIVGNTNPGGPLSLVATPSDGSVRFGALINGKIQHAIMIKDTVDGPTTNALYFGALAAGNVPTGTPKILIDNSGVLFMFSGLRIPPNKCAYVWDDFLSGGIASGVGQLGWNRGVGGAFTAAEAGRVGLYNRNTTATSGTYTYMRLAESASGDTLPAELFDITWIFRLNINDSNTLVRAGLAADASANPPADGIYIEKDFADTSWFGVTRAASSQTRTSAIASVTTNFVKFRIRRVNGSTIGFTIDGGTETTATLTIPTVALNPFITISNNAAASKTLDVDYFDMLITGLNR